MKNLLTILAVSIASSVATPLLNTTNDHINQSVSVVETVDLTNIASVYQLNIAMPNLYQTLLDFKKESHSSVTDLSFALTNPNGQTFNWAKNYPDDIEMLNYILLKNDIDLHRIIFYASAQAPYINYIIAYYFDPDQPVLETADAIGRFNWQDMDEGLWESFWTKDVKLTYQMQF